VSEGYKTVDLYELLDRRRDRPAMWLGSKDIRALNAYIAGVETLSHSSLGNGPKCYNLKADPEFEHFTRFVREKYGHTDYIHWVDALIQAEISAEDSDAWDDVPEGPEARAVDRFFRDLDEYRGAHR